MFNSRSERLLFAAWFFSCVIMYFLGPVIASVLATMGAPEPVVRFFFSFSHIAMDALGIAIVWGMVLYTVIWCAWWVWRKIARQHP